MESVKLWYIGTYGGEAQARPCSPAEFDIIHAHEGQLFVKAEDFDRVTAEREALQLMLNDRDDLDDQITSLEQRRYAEQQAREAAERRVDDLNGLLRRSRRYVEDAWPDGVHSYRRNSIGGDLLSDIDTALNPTAEAVSHE